MSTDDFMTLVAAFLEAEREADSSGLDAITDSRAQTAYVAAQDKANSLWASVIAAFDEAKAEWPADNLAGHTFRQYRDNKPPHCKCGASQLKRIYADKPHEETP